MSPVDHPEIAEVLDRVRAWPVGLRIALARRILETAEQPAPAVSVPPKTMPLDRVVGLLKTPSPPPSDEECRRIVEEERIIATGRVDQASRNTGNRGFLDA